MVGKAGFTPDEWNQIVQSVLTTGIAVSAAEPSGLFGMLKESMASARALIDAKTSQNDELIQAVVAELQTADGRTAAKTGLSSLFAGAQPTQNLVFPVTLHPERDFMMIEGRRAPLLPGMTVTVEVATGSRRILEYLFSPLVETASDAMKEW